MRSLVLWLGVALVLGGCGRPSVGAASGGPKVRVRVPDGEPASIGTFEVRLELPGRGSLTATAERDGSVVGVFCADVTGGPEPEALVATRSAGSGGYGSLSVFGVSAAGGLEPIALAEPSAELVDGYQGHDTFGLDGGAIVREFAVYGPDDPNSAPSGGSRRLAYSFAVGAWVEAGGESP